MDHLGRVHELVHDTEDEDLKRLPGKKGADQDPFHQLIHEKLRMRMMVLFLTFESVVMITNND